MLKKDTDGSSPVNERVIRLLTTGNDAKWYFDEEKIRNARTQWKNEDFNDAEEFSERAKAAGLIQSIGQQLKVKQNVINTSVVFMQRFYIFHHVKMMPYHLIAAASFLLGSKIENSMRKVDHIVDCAIKTTFEFDKNLQSPSDFFSTKELMIIENFMKNTLGFTFHVETSHQYVLDALEKLNVTNGIARESFFLASNIIQTTLFCIKYPPKLVAAFIIQHTCKDKYELKNLPSGRPWFQVIDVNLNQEMIDLLAAEYKESNSKLPETFHQFIKKMPIETKSNVLTTLNCTAIKTQCEETLEKLCALQIGDKKRKRDDEDYFMNSNLHLLANASNSLMRECSPSTKRRKMMLKKNFVDDSAMNIFPLEPLGVANNNNNDTNFQDKNLITMKRSSSLESDEVIRELKKSVHSKSVREVGSQKEWMKIPKTQDYGVDAIKEIIGAEIQNLASPLVKLPEPKNNEKVSDTDNKKSESPPKKSIRHRLPPKLKPPVKRAEFSQSDSDASTKIDDSGENYFSPIVKKKRIAHGAKDEKTLIQKFQRKSPKKVKLECGKIKQDPKPVKQSTSNCSLTDAVPMDLEELPFKESGPVSRHDHQDDKTLHMAESIKHLSNMQQIEAHREAISKQWTGQLVKRSKNKKCGKKKKSKKSKHMHKKSKKTPKKESIRVNFVRQSGSVYWKMGFV